MKKILGLTIAALLVMALVGGGTWAYFSDPEEIQDNVFSAGTLDLAVNTENAWSTALSFSAPKPGATVDMVILNDGTLDGTLTLLVSDLQEVADAELLDTSLTGVQNEMTEAQFASLIYVTGVDANGIAAVTAWIADWDVLGGGNDDGFLSLNEMVTAGAGAGLDTASLVATDTLTLRFHFGHSFAGGNGLVVPGEMLDSDDWEAYDGVDPKDYDIITTSVPWNVPQADGITVDITATLAQAP